MKKKAAVFVIGDSEVVLALNSVWPSTKLLIVLTFNLKNRSFRVAKTDPVESVIIQYINLNYSSFNKSDFGLFYAIYVLGSILLPSIFDQDLGNDSRKQF